MSKQGELGDVLWEASAMRKKQSHLNRFMKHVNTKYEGAFATWDDLYIWSIKNRAQFWGALADYTKIHWNKTPDRAYIAAESGQMGKGVWFPGGSLNYAQNLLPPGDCEELVVAVAEGERRRSYSRNDLRVMVATVATDLKSMGVSKGDVIAGVLTHSIEALVVMLATSSLGAVWASCSPDFGIQAIVDRLSQVKAKCLFFSSSYTYSQKKYSCLAKMVDCLNLLPDKPELIIVEHHEEIPLDSIDIGRSYAEIIAKGAALSSPPSLNFQECDFNDPLFILFSSGTTGKPKAIVHAIGRTLLQHKKELMLHCDLQEGERLMFFTTCAWMMWNWQCSALAVGARLVCYDGSPGSPDLNCQWDIVDNERVNIFGTSPKFLQSCRQRQLAPSKTHKLSTLKGLLTTGSPLLSPEARWVYSDLKRDIHLASICGGTDIVSCFMLGNPLLPVRAGEIQAPGLGMEIEAWDECGNAVIDKKSELVCIGDFVSMPLGFLNDTDHSKYEATYFHHFPGRHVWCHGDFISITKNGGIIVSGRSDTTLNPGGVRIGTSEIYRITEQIREISDSIVVGYLNAKGDCEVTLFVKLLNLESLSQELVDSIKQQIKKQLSPRHVPQHIFSVKEIPYTANGKKLEVVVRRILNREGLEKALAMKDQAVLDCYKKIAESFFPRISD